MKEAVEKAWELSESGDSILLSPACASWDQYKTFEKRGEDFVKEIKHIVK
jgi:UDP-N-acetylmuramoylalanine--D-glutamate ligase